MPDIPFTFDIPLPGGVPGRYDHHLVRTLSSMRGQYADAPAFQAALERADAVLYEVYEMRRPQAPGDLAHGVTIIHPGRVGREYVMTKGHYHAVLETAEVYYGLSGEGMMVMETPEGDARVEEIRPGCVVFVPPRWAHRTANTGAEDLVFLWVYPAHAGHNYGAIEQHGFRKLVVESDGRPAVVDNPRWRAPHPAGGNHGG